MFFFYICSYINVYSIAWESMYKTKLKRIFTYQKKVARVTFFTDTFAHAKLSMLDIDRLNLYQTNIYRNLLLLYKVHTATASSIFFHKF